MLVAIAVYKLLRLVLIRYCVGVCGGGVCICVYVCVCVVCAYVCVQVCVCVSMGGGCVGGLDVGVAVAGGWVGWVWLCVVFGWCRVLQC